MCDYKSLRSVDRFAALRVGKEWRRRADLNCWFYGFANRSLGPLGHVSIERISFGALPYSVNDFENAQAYHFNNLALILANLRIFHGF